MEIIIPGGEITSINQGCIHAVPEFTFRIRRSVVADPGREWFWELVPSLEKSGIRPCLCVLHHRVL